MAHRGHTLFCNDCDKPFRVKANMRGSVDESLSCPYCRSLNPTPTDGPTAVFQIPVQHHVMFHLARAGHQKEALALAKQDVLAVWLKIGANP